MKALNRNLIKEQKEYEDSMARHKNRLEAKARALYNMAKVSQRELTYEEIWYYVIDSDESDYGCEPSPTEWERMKNAK
jgi:uncharacterized Fe-S cluster-containing protein